MISTGYEPTYTWSEVQKQIETAVKHDRKQRTWVGLTEEERNHARKNVTYSQLAMTVSEWADAVQIETEQRLMEKNK